MPKASVDSLDAAESDLGFKLPALIRDCLADVANGGFGPGYGFIGVSGGYESDFGTLVNTYRQLRNDKESEGDEWPDRILPFCEWGSAIFSCVDCETLDVWTFRDFELEETDIKLNEFIERWANGESAELIESGHTKRTTTIKNPLTGEDTDVSTGP